MGDEKGAGATLVAPKIHLFPPSLCFSPAEKINITKETRSFLPWHSESRVVSSKDGGHYFWKRQVEGVREAIYRCL